LYGTLDTWVWGSILIFKSKKGKENNMEKSRLNEMILDYIKNNKGCDSVDIVINFKIRADIIMQSLSNLQKQKLIERYAKGAFYGYRVLNQKT
jgi:hypothetical protein